MYQESDTIITACGRKKFQPFSKEFDSQSNITITIREIRIKQTDSNMEEQAVQNENFGILEKVFSLPFLLMLKLLSVSCFEHLQQEMNRRHKKGSRIRHCISEQTDLMVLHLNSSPHYLYLTNCKVNWCEKMKPMCNIALPKKLISKIRSQSNRGNVVEDKPKH